MDRQRRQEAKWENFICQAIREKYGYEIEGDLLVGFLHRVLSERDDLKTTLKALKELLEPTLKNMSKDIDTLSGALKSI